MSDQVKYQVMDVYLAAYMSSQGFPMEIELITPTKVAFVFSGTQEQIDNSRNHYFHDPEIQGFVGQIRQLKISLYDHLRRAVSNIHADGELKNKLIKD